jgi:choline transport protein
MVHLLIFLCLSLAFVLPVTVELMNWNSVILVGTIAVTAFYWVIEGRAHYPGPKVMDIYISNDSNGKGFS